MPKRRRKNRTEQEREQIIMAYEAIPVSQRKTWLASVAKINPGYFYRMRKRFLAAHPEFQLTDVAEVPVTAAVTSVVPFTSMSREDKLAAIQEYDKLPREEKKAWREAHQLDDGSGTMTYWRKQFAREPKTAMVRSNGLPLVTPELFREYEALNGMRRKGEWLKAHGMNRNQFYQYHHQINGTTANPVGRPTKYSQATVLPSVQHVLSVDDMINAFKVERDMLTDVITKMERMRAGHN